MTNRLFKRIGAAAGSFILAASAFAVPPEMTTFVVVQDFMVVGCGEFDVRAEAETKFTIKEWFDEYGDVIDVQYQIKVIQSEYYNSEFPEISISQGKKGVGENITAKLDPLTGEYSEAGLYFRLTIPGIGRVLMTTGVLKIDEEGNFVIHGQDFFVAEGETGLALCEALAH